MRAFGQIALILLFAGCVPRLDDCAQDDDCPVDRACSGGYCLPPDLGVDEVDRAAPPDALIDGPMIEVDQGAAAEACNQIDDDGDGIIDEGVPSERCQAGIGACLSEGVARCVAGEMVCDAAPGLPMAEICNQIDDDCDGAADEAGDEGLCCPRAELCNGIDDDCDGFVDDFLALGEARQIDTQPAGGPFALDVAIGRERVVILTHSDGAGRLALHAYQRATLSNVERVAGINFDPRETTRIVPNGQRFVCVGVVQIEEGLAGIEAARLDFTRDPVEGLRTSAVQGGEVDAVSVVPAPDGAAVIFAHSVGESEVVRRDLANHFMMPSGTALPTVGYEADGGFGAVVIDDTAHMAWEARGGLDTGSFVPNAPFQPGPLRVEAAEAPTMFRVGDDDALLAWYLPGEPEARLGMATFFSGKRLTVGPIMPEQPTGTAISVRRFALGWRAAGEAFVGLFQIDQNSIEPIGIVNLGLADQPPALAANDDLLTAAWLRDRGVMVQHFDVGPMCSARF